MRELERDRPTDTAAEAPLRGDFTVVGPGRVGKAIGAAAAQAGIEVRLTGRGDALEAARTAETVLLCVPDDAIGAAAEAIRDAVPPLRFVGHVSGASGLDRLDPCRSRGAEAFSLHPLQTIPSADADLTGAPCAVAGSSPAAEQLAAALAERLAMRPFAVAEERRAAYHAAAAIASNFLVALEESAAELLARAGIDDARELLAPLVLRSAANWADRGEQALTGPIARGDEETVARHRAALAELAPELLPLYDALAQRTRDIARPGTGGREPR